jgi:hypothetical protein
MRELGFLDDEDWEAVTNAEAQGAAFAHEPVAVHNESGAARVERAAQDGQQVRTDHGAPFVSVWTVSAYAVSA